MFAWRKLFAEGQQESGDTICALPPVTLLAATVMAQPVAGPAHACAGVIELTVGKARLRLEGTVDATALPLLLQRLLP